jgi:hypothetical protein
VKPIDFAGSNAKLSPPPDAPDDVSGMPVLVGDMDGQKVTISCWELSDAELWVLTTTRKVWLMMGIPPESVPPVAMVLKPPFKVPS